VHPADTCASIQVQRFSESDLEKRQKNASEELRVLGISDEDLKDAPVLNELIIATHYVDFPLNDSAISEIDILELVEHEKYLMEKAKEKYNDTDEDYFVKLDTDIEEKLQNPAKEGFSNEFLAPMVVYKNKSYAIGRTTFWVADEHQPRQISIHLMDDTGDRKFVTLDESDMDSLPKIKEAIEKIGKSQESVVATKGVPEPEWDEYRKWFESKTLEQFGEQKHSAYLFVYTGEYYEAGFPIC
jgi:hypothetical protein